MCYYCSGTASRVHNSAYFKGMHFGTSINFNHNNISTYCTYDGDTDNGFTIPISYCPFCGEKLAKVNYYKVTANLNLDEHFYKRHYKWVEYMIHNSHELSCKSHFELLRTDALRAKGGCLTHKLDPNDITQLKIYNPIPIYIRTKRNPDSDSDLFKYLISKEVEEDIRYYFNMTERRFSNKYLDKITNKYLDNITYEIEEIEPIESNYNLRIYVKELL